MDIYFLKVLNEYRQRGHFDNFSSEEFQKYCQNTYLYPIAIFLQIITTYWESIETLNDYIERLKYFNIIIPKLYQNIYNNDEQQIIITYLVLLNSNRLSYGTKTQTMNDLKDIFNTTPIAKEIIEIQKILKYNYIEFLILYSPNKQEEIGTLLQELEHNPPILTLNELSQYKN